MSFRTEFGATFSFTVDTADPLEIYCDGCSHVLIQVKSLSGAITYLPQISIDTINFVSQRAINFKTGNVTAAGTAINAVNDDLYIIPVSGATKFKLIRSTGAGSFKASVRPLFAGSSEYNQTVTATITGGVSIAPANTTPVAAGAAADTVIKAAPGSIANVMVSASGTNAMSIFDNAAGHTGTLIGYIPANTPAGSTFSFNFPAANGITVQGNAQNPAVTIGWS